MVGIYFLLKNNIVVYVGQSKNISRRIKEHRDKDFDRYTTIECDEELLNRTEESYILLHNPKYNKRKAEINTNKKKPKEKIILTLEEKQVIIRKFWEDQRIKSAESLKNFKILKEQKKSLKLASKVSGLSVTNIIINGAVKEAKKILREIENGKGK